MSGLGALENTSYRVAFDLGSGKVKMQAAIVDEVSLRIIKVLDISEISIPLRESIDQDSNGCISEDMIQLLLTSLTKLQNQASLHGSVSKSVGVATEPFRVAKNGKEVLKKIQDLTGIHLFCLLPEEEALLGVKALQAEGKIASMEESISWENGGGSMQITFSSKEGSQFFTKNLGKVPVKNYIIRQIQGKDPKKHISPNPISQSQAKATLAWLEEELKDAPYWLKENPSIKVIALGAIFPNLHKTLAKIEVTKKDLVELLADRIGKTDEELEGGSDPIFMVSDLLFLYAVMEKLHIEKVEYSQLKGPGSTSGLLIDVEKWTDF